MKKPTLFFRTLEPEDTDFLYEMENRENHLSVGEHYLPFSRECLQRFIFSSMLEDLLSSGQLRLIVCRMPPAGKRKFQMPPIGILDFFNYDALHRRAEVGILVQKDYRRKGYGKIILQEACDYAKNRLNLHQLSAEVAVNNAGSIRTFQQCAFTPCGTRKEWLLQNGKWVDVSLWQKIFE